MPVSARKSGNIHRFVKNVQVRRPRVGSPITRFTVGPCYSRSNFRLFLTVLTILSRNDGFKPGFTLGLGPPCVASRVGFLSFLHYFSRFEQFLNVKGL